MSKKVPTIRSSAQARLLLYHLLSANLSEAQQSLLSVDSTSWEQIIARLEGLLESDIHMKSNRNVLAQAFSLIDKTTREGLQNQLERLVGQSLWLGAHSTSLLESFVDEHLKLIKSVQREHLDKIGLAIKRGIREGRLHKEIAKDIRQMTDMSKRRAQLIARNAPLQYSGALTKQHQMNAGIKQYHWQTSHDERVRASHKSREGKIYSWDGPGPHPRSEVNCRCDAVPMVDL